MNCPQCKEPVGDDEFGYGPWVRRITGELDTLDVRTLAIRCDHCGVFEIRERMERKLTSVSMPVKDVKALRRLEKLIPACQKDRRLPA